jgi:uncharacterized protein (DUF1778 family)
MAATSSTTSVLSVQVSSAERAVLEAAAEQSHTSLSEFVRRRALESAETDVLNRSIVSIPANACANQISGVSRVNAITDTASGRIAGYVTLSAARIERAFPPRPQQRNRPEPFVSALARALGRQYRRVQADVAALEQAGLLDRSEGEVRTTADRISAEINL